MDSEYLNPRVPAGTLSLAGMPHAETALLGTAPSIAVPFAVLREQALTRVCSMPGPPVPRVSAGAEGGSSAASHGHGASGADLEQARLGLRPAGEPRFVL